MLSSILSTNYKKLKSYLINYLNIKFLSLFIIVE